MAKSENNLFVPQGRDIPLWILAFLVWIITLLIYFPALQNGFVNWDDGVYVYENQHIKFIDPGFLMWIFTPEANPTWHPLTLFSIALDYAVWGLKPFGYHLTNILFHAFNSCLVFLLVVHLIECKPNYLSLSHRSLFLTAALVTALFFGIHPLHVESVAWISERKDVLYAFFFLLSIIIYLKYAATSLKKYYLLSFIFFILSFMSKPMAVTLPVTLLIIDFYPLKRLKTEGSYKKILIEKLPFIALSFSASLMTIWAQQSGKALQSLEDLPIIARSFMAIHSYIFYLSKMCLPFNLSPFYPYAKTTYLTYESLLSLILVLAITLFILFHRNRFYSAIWAYYMITLLPVIGVIKVGAFAAADRYTYLSSLGPFLLLGVGVWRFFEICTKKQKMALTAALFFLFGIMTYKTLTQIAVWKDSITLWSRTIDIFPYSTKGYINRGRAYLGMENNWRAIKDLDMAIRLAPMSLKAYGEPANAYNSRGRYQEAVKDADETAKINTTYADVYNLRGAAYVNIGDYNQAIKDFDMAVRLDPRSSEAYYNRGTIYRSLKDNYQAIRDFSTAIRLNPLYAEAYNNRGNAYRELEKYQEAIEDYNTAIKLNPKDAIAYKNRGIAHRKSGNNEEAMKDFEKADELSPR